MFARLVSGQVVGGKVAQATKIWKEKDFPLKQSEKGYLGGYFLTDSKTGNFISMTLWNTQEDAIAYIKSKRSQSAIDMYKGILDAQQTQVYEINAQDKIRL